MAKYRTPKKNRATYIYSFADGSKFVIRPGENDINEADIAELHRGDDNEWNNDYQQIRPHVCNPNGTISYDDVDETEAWISGETTDPLEQLIVNEGMSETRLIVHNAISKLPEKQAKAVTNVWIDGVPAREYAKMIGTTESNISALLRRAFANLRKIITL